MNFSGIRHISIGGGQNSPKPDMPTKRLPRQEAELGGVALIGMPVSIIGDCEEKTGKKDGRRIFMA